MRLSQCNLNANRQQPLTAHAAKRRFSVAGPESLCPFPPACRQSIPESGVGLEQVDLEVLAYEQLSTKLLLDPSATPVSFGSRKQQSLK